MSKFYEINPSPQSCSVCLEKYSKRVEDPCGHLVKTITQQELTVEEYQDSIVWYNKQNQLKSKIVSKQKARIKELKDQIAVADVAKEQEVEQTRDTLIAMTEAKLSEIKSAKVSPLVYGGLAILLIAAIIFGVVIWMKVKSALAAKVEREQARMDEMALKSLTKAMSDHVIRESTHKEGGIKLEIIHKDAVDYVRRGEED